MIERACIAADLITRELRPEVAAIFSIFPIRGPRCYSVLANVLTYLHSSPPSVLVTWHAPEEDRTFSQGIVCRCSGDSV